MIEIARRSRARSEIYHLKALGPVGAAQFNGALSLIATARDEGLPVTADAYPYAASGTGLDAAMPPWVQEGGLEAWIGRLADRDIRRRVLAEMQIAEPSWENHLRLAGGGDQVLLSGFKSRGLKHLTGRTLSDVARDRSTSSEEAAMDLVIKDRSRVEAIYFNQSEEVLRTVLAQPWVSLGSDEASLAPEPPFLASNPHPRAYGTFARFLGRFVREERIVALSEAIRRITSLPAENLGLTHRGRVRPGAFADLVIFDPDTITDCAGYDAPHQYAVGVDHVIVNGQVTLLDGAHTGVRARRAIRRT